ncbi:hypothetical protein VIGAN_01022600, partial [Vigna angularis var. angularis]
QKTFNRTCFNYTHQRQQNLNIIKSTRNKDGGPHCNTTLSEHASTTHSDRTSNMGDHIKSNNDILTMQHSRKTTIY